MVAEDIQMGREGTFLARILFGKGGIGIIRHTIPMIPDENGRERYLLIIEPEFWSGLHIIDQWTPRERELGMFDIVVFKDDVWPPLNIGTNYPWYFCCKTSRGTDGPWAEKTWVTEKNFEIQELRHEVKILKESLAREKMKIRRFLRQNPEQNKLLDKLSDIESDLRTMKVNVGGKVGGTTTG